MHALNQLSAPDLAAEGWVIKNWCFWTVVLEKILESPLDSKEIKPVNPKGNQPWIFTGRSDAKLKLQYSGYLMRRVNSLEETLMLGKIEGRRRSGWQRMRWLDGIIDSIDWVWANSGRWWKTGKPGVLKFMGLQSWTWFSDWTTATIYAKLVAGIIYLVLMPIGLVLFYLYFIRKTLQQGGG